MTLNMKDILFNKLSKAKLDVILRSADIAEECFFNIYLIGGIVRDLIMDNPVNDIDIVVEGDAVQFADKMKDYIDCEVINVQENLKTAKVRFINSEEIDFASTREETYIKSGVLPVADNFGCSLENDVKRRDFTINTLAITLTGENKYKLLDYCSGYQDISDKKIKILHEKSFIDDPSRIIRALKFKERFNFEYDKQTYNLMRQYLKKPDEQMPLERVKSELKQYFSIKKDNIYDEIIRTEAYKLISDNPVKNLDFGRLDKIIPFDIFEKSEIWFICFLCLIIKSDFALARLNLTAFEIKILMQIRTLLSVDINNNDNEGTYKIYKDKENLSVVVYYLITGNENVIKYLKDLRGIKVLVTGNDLINLGFTPSKHFSEIFDKILKEKLKGNIKTKEDEIEYIKKENG